MTEAIRQGDIPGVQLRCRRRLPLASCEALWPWLTDPSRLSCWLATVVQVSASGPEELEIRSGDVSEIARTVAIDRPRRWVFDFERRGSGWSRATRVTCEAVDRVDGCELSIFHEGFQHLPLSLCLSAWEEYRTRWARALERLEREIRAGAQDS